MQFLSLSDAQKIFFNTTVMRKCIVYPWKSKNTVDVRLYRGLCSKPLSPSPPLLAWVSSRLLWAGRRALAPGGPTLQHMISCYGIALHLFLVFDFDLPMWWTASLTTSHSMGHRGWETDWRFTRSSGALRLTTGGPASKSMSSCLVRKVWFRFIATGQGT